METEGVGLWLAAKTAATFHKSACVERDLCVLPPAANPGYLLYFNNIINERLSGECRLSEWGPRLICVRMQNTTRDFGKTDCDQAKDNGKSDRLAEKAG